MVVTDFGIFIEVKPEQPSKVLSPMVVTDFGISIEVKLLQPSNARFPMLVTEFGITVLLQPTISALLVVSIIALQLFLES